MKPIGESEPGSMRRSRPKTFPSARSAELKRLRAARTPVTKPAGAFENNDPVLTAGWVRWAIKARQIRSRYFETDLFADPAWDMMLELLLAELVDRPLTVSDLCGAARVPMTTALRWQSTLVERGLFIRRLDPCDARRVYVELAPDTSRALRSFLADLQLGSRTAPSVK